MKNQKSFALLVFLLFSVLTSGCGVLNSNFTSSFEGSSTASSSQDMKAVSSGLALSEVVPVNSASVSSVIVSSAPIDTRATNIFSVKTIYSYTDTSAAMPIEQVADILVKQMLDDLSKPDDANRTFYITSYKNINIHIISYKDNEWKGFYPELNKNLWLMSGAVQIQFSGELSPVGYSNTVPKDMYFTDRLDNRYISKEGNTYTLIEINTYRKNLH